MKYVYFVYCKGLMSVAVFEGRRGEGCKQVGGISSMQGSIVWCYLSSETIDSKCRQPELCVMCSVHAYTVYILQYCVWCL
jgi:hypothetical protein